jgi:excisionase family DNA binding protein
VSEKETSQTAIAVSVERVIEMSGLGRTYVWGAIRTASLPSYRVGRRILVRVEDLDSWIRAHASGAAARARQQKVR